MYWSGLRLTVLGDCALPFSIAKTGKPGIAMIKMMVRKVAVSFFM